MKMTYRYDTRIDRSGVTAGEFQEAFIAVLRTSPTRAPSLPRIAEQLGVGVNVLKSDAVDFRRRLLLQRGFKLTDGHYVRSP